jgi:predicted short-subunit dehydrogenase-like oxidoreductase (DUF2520 family)
MRSVAAGGPDWAQGQRPYTSLWPRPLAARTGPVHGQASNELSKLRLVSPMRELERDSNFPSRGSATQSTSAASLPVLVIVGAGRVGTAIHRAARNAGLQADLARGQEADEAAGGAEIALLCVPDAAIEEACAAIVRRASGLRFVGHTSGATGLDALEPARAAGAEVFSLHPLQTIPDGAAELARAPCAISASHPPAARLARRLAVALGMRPFELPEDSRAAYHAAASIASNYLVTLEESAAELLRRAGFDRPRELLGPLVLRTALNWSERGGEALTGPIARGDAETIDRHLAALEQLQPELLDAYRALAERTRALAREQAAA